MADRAFNLSANAPRFRPGTDAVESWFLRANDPRAPRAVWVKATVICRADGDELAEAWCCLFDGDRTAAFRGTWPLQQARFDGGPTVPMEIAIGKSRLHLDTSAGVAAGSLQSGVGGVSWDLSFQRLEGPLGEPACLFPRESLLDASLPKGKLVTPFPAAAFQGRLVWGDTTWDLGGWYGMQGHNWGPAHTPRYAWGHCLFLDDHLAPRAVVEAISARVQLGPVQSPFLSMMTVRHAFGEHRFDRILDVWNHQARLDFPEWSLGMSGPDGHARLTLRGRPERMVQLGYDNPSSPRSYCLNGKTAHATLKLVTGGEGANFESEHGGALEFLQPEMAMAVLPVV